ncbi:SET domain-containing protein [Lojkania enalia]|uniref:SET domain-containing protein n=1 Tax=Lojkania enalia TaxID=147567 RepID=A0A9P4MXQ9_9PLEO|nr:SET domain-containing protein [Didymosphaeria enalia]
MTSASPRLSQEQGNRHLKSNVNTTNRIGHLLRWFRDNGGWLNINIRIAYDQSRGFHAQAVDSLTAPFFVATCPIDLTLSYLNLDNSQKFVPHVESPLRELLGQVPSHVLSYLFLIEQTKIGHRSRWAPYISCLPGPKDMTTPIWFDDEDFKILEGTNLRKAAAERLGTLERELDSAKEIMHGLGWSDVEKDKYDLTSFKWAATIMTSRTFTSSKILPDLPKFGVLFPIIDILNHDVNAKVGWDFVESQSFSLKVFTDVEAGAEIYNTYAPKANDELLMGYGFCIPDNPVEQSTIVARTPPGLIPTDWFTSDLIPFAMPESLLDDYRDHEPQLLRTRGHPFGRYESMIPFFRGFPPAIVFITYLITLHTRNIDPRTVSLPYPGGRIVFAILQQLYRAIDARCNAIPPREPLPATANEKQKFAKIYRDGQLKINLALQDELRYAMGKVMNISTTPASFMHNLLANPCIITTTEATQVLEAEFPLYYTQFKKGMQSQWEFDVQTDIKALSTRSISEDKLEDVLWTILLVIYFTVSATSPDSLINRWVQELLTSYPLLPNIASDFSFDEDSLPEVAFDTCEGCREDRMGAIWDMVAQLERQGPGLRSRAFLWAASVVQGERIDSSNLPHPPKYLRTCLYMEPVNATRAEDYFS